MPTGKKPLAPKPPVATPTKPPPLPAAAKAPLPLQVQRVVAGMVAGLSSAQGSIGALRRMLHFGLTVLLGVAAASGVSAASNLALRALIVAAFLSVGATLRYLLGAALSWGFRRAAR